MSETEAGKIKVVMHNNLVRQATYGLAKLGALEHKIIAAAVAQIDHRSETIPDIELSVNELAKACGIEGRSIYQRAREAARRLRREEIIFIDPSTGDEVIAGWMSVARYQKGGALVCKFADDLKPVLTALKERRTEMELESIMQIGGSAYAHRLYQIACSWRSNAGWITELEKLREQLGVPADAYKANKDFRRYVLDRPIEAINSRTDLQIAYEKANKGRQWFRIRFYVQSQGRSDEPKKAEKVPAWEAWWDDLSETDTGQDEIWKLARELGLVTGERAGLSLSRRHSLFQHAPELYRETKQTKML